MDQITITRDEFKERIRKNPRGYGLLRYMREHPGETEGREMKMLIEELTLTMILGEVEEDLFGKPQDASAGSN
jgi:hypothetical protein